MENNEITLMEQNRKKLSIKSMYFNRYLLIRYVSALFFFTHLYWLISMFMSGSTLFFIPLMLIIALVISIAEQVKIYSNHTNNAKRTKYCFIMLLLTNVTLILSVCFSSIFTHLYPFLFNQDKTRILVLVILFIGILLSVFVLYRLNQIKHNEDKHFKRIKQYEEIIS
ncbi:MULTISPECIES: hypothetical protein [Virgibacillus]|uniref:hypothetical protein n=1 Tax=Virgibacillus TaxID=84406 RepID=UPI00090C5CDF|nr:MULTISPECIES: hypothetical protein [Virgibacillus]API92142.1 hypothetical protein BKP57_10055 [Virgibacillus sp. 6R]MBS7427266.1 hypothetical protein [Virgibacillus sp. 19R1-5]